MSEEIPQVKLDAIPATRRVVSRLYFAGLIDRGVRERALGEWRRGRRGAGAGAVGRGS